MKFTRAAIPDVVIVEPKVFGDARGSFMETWESAKFAAAGIDVPFVQDNHSISGRAVLRGLHYQLRHTQGKLVRVAVGEVYDVAVDMRRSSPTFGKYVGETLSAENKRMLWVPPGFAHGFFVLSERAEFLYKCTDYYDPASERSVLWSDPQLGIAWPRSPDLEPIVSPKDSAAPAFAAADCFP
jgi:dTDP-4-dehydrorhamnose 3,5-epimerase